MKRPHGFDSGPADQSNAEKLAPITRGSRSPVQANEAPKIIATETSDAPAVAKNDAPIPIQRDVDVVDAQAESDGTDQAALEAQTPRAQLEANSQRAKEALRNLRVARRERKQQERLERRRFTRFSRIRKRRWFIALGAVVSLALFVLIGVVSPALNLQKITVIGTQRLDAAAVAESLGGQLGKPLAFVDSGEIHDALSNFTLIQKYSVETMPPHELIVRIVERKPVLNLKRGEGFDLVDPAGVVIESAQARIPGFPVGDALVVDVNSAAFTAAATSLAYMQPELAAQVDVASATTDQDVTFRLGSGLTIVWGSSEQSVRKSVLVNKMLTALAGRPVSTIDVSSTEAPVFS